LTLFISMVAKPSLAEIVGDPFQAFLETTRLRDVSIAIQAPPECHVDYETVSEAMEAALTQGDAVPFRPVDGESYVAVTVLGGLHEDGECFGFIGIRLVRQHKMPLPDSPWEEALVEFVLIDYGQLISASRSDFPPLVAGAALALTSSLAHEIKNARAAADNPPQLSHSAPRCRSPVIGESCL
jgi:hypothetical protein